MHKKILEILACPQCKSNLEYKKKAQELICYSCAIAFPIRDGIPVMLENEARTLDTDERLKTNKTSE